MTLTLIPESLSILTHCAYKYRNNHITINISVNFTTFIYSGDLSKQWIHLHAIVFKRRHKFTFTRCYRYHSGRHYITVVTCTTTIVHCVLLNTCTADSRPVSQHLYRTKRCSGRCTWIVIGNFEF